MFFSGFPMKITERIKNIIELKCNIDLDWKYALKRTNHAHVYETSFVHKPSQRGVRVSIKY